MNNKLKKVLRIVWHVVLFLVFLWFSIIAAVSLALLLQGRDASQNLDQFLISIIIIVVVIFLDGGITKKAKKNVNGRNSTR